MTEVEGSNNDKVIVEDWNDNMGIVITVTGLEMTEILRKEQR